MLIWNLIVRRETPETRRTPSHVAYHMRRYLHVDNTLALLAARPSVPRWDLRSPCIIQLVELLEINSDMNITECSQSELPLLYRHSVRSVAYLA